MKKPAAPQPENISREDLLELTLLGERADRARQAAADFGRHLVSKYSLGATDSLDMATGRISRNLGPQAIPQEGP